MADYKQVIVYNKNANIPFNTCLKYIVQGSLKSVESSLEFSKNKVENWLRFGQKKITVQIPTESELLAIQQICTNKKIINVLLNTDTNIPCLLVLGPDLEKVLDPITSHLKLF